MDNPDFSSWRQKKHVFNDLPAHVKGHVREQLKVPTIHSETLLPNSRMSVLDLVNMDLPPISSGQDAYSNISWTFSFFSPSEPINDIAILKKVIVLFFLARPRLMTSSFLNRLSFHPKALLPSFSTK